MVDVVEVGGHVAVVGVAHGSGLDGDAGASRFELEEGAIEERCSRPICHVDDKAFLICAGFLMQMGNQEAYRAQRVKERLGVRSYACAG